MNPRHPPVNDLPAHQVGVELKRHRWTLAVAESCTGGLITHRLTNLPGSSTYFIGGVVAYANAVKAGVLGVPEPMLAMYGAVSEEVAREMAQGVRQLLQANVGLAVTGIAGPGGGTPAKPVGLVWIALSSPRGTIAAELHLKGDRLQIKEEAAETALRMLNTHLGEGSNATG